MGEVPTGTYPQADGGVMEVLYIRTANDANGNPRRGWLFLDGDRREWHEEGYAGVQAFRAQWLQSLAVDALTVNVTPSEYRRLKKTATVLAA